MALAEGVDQAMGLIVRINAPPQGDVIFLSTDSYGTPGALNTVVLKQLGLDEGALPNAERLAAGYALQEGPSDALLCFVVSVSMQSPVPTAPFSSNLEAALEDPTLEAAHSLWIPLMGTGAGELSWAESFELITGALGRTGWLERPDARIVISAPPEARAEMERISEALSSPPSGPPTKTAKPPANLGAGADAYAWPMTAAVRAALELAARLRTGRNGTGGQLSTTLLFFALAESRSPAAPGDLVSDPDAGLFSAAVRQVLGPAYIAGWGRYFSVGFRLAPGALSGALPSPTPNVRSVFDSALARAREARRAEITIDDLVQALCSFEKGHFDRAINAMASSASEILEEYRDAKVGRIDLKLFNDVAALKDSLGYDSYAEAIRNFLVHADTPPPISISIQAPWGAGKSSLMHLLREKLDPKDDREAAERALSASLGPELALGAVMDFIDHGKKPANPLPPAEGKRWSVWFNAWKYETSEQVWAGLVDAIVAEVSRRLPLAERELFLLRLQLARIDEGEVRRRVYDHVLTLWWGQIRRWTIAAGGAVLGLFGIGGAHALDPDAPFLAGLARIATWSGSGVLIAIGAYVAFKFFETRSKAEHEPAKYSLADYIKAPNYDASVGSIHHIHKDLLKVLNLVPPRPDGRRPPIVIFIDDLDRCSPSKVAAVVEGVSMFLASDDYKCLFVIGMDPQMVAAALETSHADVLEHLPKYERAIPLGWRFMDKFIQLPFTIPPSDEISLRKFVADLGGAPAGPRPARPAPRTARAARPASVRAQASTGSSRGDVGTQRSSDADAAQAKSLQADFVESRDVGRIISRLADYTAGNPREIKRMANLARFYLQLRNVRRDRDPAWNAPDLDQYARWIALATRWPDMLRWLLWGADEATWTAAEQKTASIVVRRLKALEDIASSGPGLARWKTAAAKKLDVPKDSPSDWVLDVKLFEFFRDEAGRAVEERISSAAQIGFC